MKKLDNYIKEKDIRDMLERQGKKCALTGWDLTPQTAQVDHIVPLAKGGDHAINNLMIVHSTINSAKGTLDLDEFLHMCKAVTSKAKQ